MAVFRPGVPTWGEPSNNAEGANLVSPNPLISVCIANHNYGRFLRAAIDSALDQTYSNVEVIVVDDGSTDDSRRVIERYRDRVRTVMQTREGQAAAGWTGVQAARGDVVVFLDADDMLDPEICRHIADSFEQDPTLVIVQWRLRTIDADGRPLARVLPPRPGLLPSGDLSDHVLRVRNWHYQLMTGPSLPMSCETVMTAELLSPEGENGAHDVGVRVERRARRFGGGA